MFKVRRLFSSTKKPVKTIDELGASVDAAGVSMSASAVNILPRLAVPASPHPVPYERIAIALGANGLLLRPDTDNAASHVRIAWGKTATIESLDGPGEDDDWADGAFIYGIVGILRLFNASYLLVVDSRTEAGNLLDEYHPVFGVKHVSAIPLDAEAAKRPFSAVKALNALDRAAALAAATLSAEPSDEPVEVPVIQESLATPAEEDAEPLDRPPTPHVRFASEVDLREAAKRMGQLQRPPSPIPSINSSTNSSGRSSPTSASSPISPVSKALAERMSFWNLIARTGSAKSSAVAAQVASNLENDAPLTTSLDKILDEEFSKQGIDRPAPSEVVDAVAAASAKPPSTVEEQNKELEGKVVRETVRLFSKGGMYFAYSFDLTTPLQRKRQQVAKNRHRASLLNDLDALPSDTSIPTISEDIDVLAEPNSNLPLWRRVDRRFWWNQSLIQPFLDAGLHSYVLPIMQGYFQVSSFTVPAPDLEGILGTKEIVEDRPPSVDGATEEAEEAAQHVTLPGIPAPEEQPDLAIPVEYIVVSRRSRDRAGLRYQRRGVDDNANVANFVETEIIMRIPRYNNDNVFSYIQIRGSIPLFWTQPGYSLKPAPQLDADRSPEQNRDAIKRHFERTIPVYGPHTIVNLSEQHGKEGVITNAYRDFATELANEDVHYTEYDFHAETKGMKYENIANLITQLGRAFETQGFLWVCGKTTLSEQRGVFRVNCIDCLDRTNVVQSAFARNVLQKQLGTLALLHEGTSKTDADVVFNDVWANNGDAISQEYAGTSALKGDFTRTGKRDITGMLHDGVNSLARVYSSTFSDWFSQTVIDYMLGNRSLSVFSEFLHNLASTDPRELLRISKVREAAIETCTARALNQGERLLSGWTLFSPVDLNTRISDRFEEKVLLLTAKALYIVSYDYNLEKVKMSTRIPLGDIVGLRKGSYILSALEETSRDPVQNYGFVIAYLPTHQDSRVSSYTVRNTVDAAAVPLPPSAPSTPMPTATGFSKRISLRPLVSRSNTNVLSRILTNVAIGTNNNDTLCVAFKALSVDTAKERRGSALAGLPFKEPSSCKDAVDRMVESIRDACADVGAVHSENFVIEKDIVSLAEAQSTTSVYARLEYGVKRLLWLGN